MTVYIKIDEPSWFAVAIDVLFQLNSLQLYGLARFDVITLFRKGKKMYKNQMEHFIWSFFSQNCLKFHWVVYRLERCYHFVSLIFFFSFISALTYSHYLAIFLAFKCLFHKNSITFKTKSNHWLVLMALSAIGHKMHNKTDF